MDYNKEYILEDLVLRGVFWVFFFFLFFFKVVFVVVVVRIEFICFKRNLVYKLLVKVFYIFLNLSFSNSYVYRSFFFRFYFF